jgi:hypothetical protein
MLDGEVETNESERGSRAPDRIYLELLLLFFINNAGRWTTTDT